MAQHLFSAAAELSLTPLDANFSELYVSVRPGEMLGPGATIRHISAGVIGYRTDSPVVGGNNHHFSFSYFGGGSMYGLGFTPGADNTYPVTFASAAGTKVGGIYTTATGTAYQTTSDRRLKAGISPPGDSGRVIDGVRIVAYSWRNVPDATPVRFGVIAQELVDVYPEAVYRGDRGEEIEDVWQVDYSRLVPLLVAEVQALRRRVAALEAAA